MPSVGGNVSIGATSTTNGFPTMNGDSNGHVVTNAPGMSAGRSEISCLGIKIRSSAHSDEIALYDRQIRLWGVKAQEK